MKKKLILLGGIGASQYIIDTLTDIIAMQMGSGVSCLGVAFSTSKKSTGKTVGLVAEADIIVTMSAGALRLPAKLSNKLVISVCPPEPRSVPGLIWGTVQSQISNKPNDTSITQPVTRSITQSLRDSVELTSVSRFSIYAKLEKIDCTRVVLVFDDDMVFPRGLYDTQKMAKSGILFEEMTGRHSTPHLHPFEFATKLEELVLQNT